MTIKQIRAALEKATPGPWHLLQPDPFGGGHVECRSVSAEKPVDNRAGDGVIEPTGYEVDGLMMRNADAEVVINAPSWLAWCLEQIEARDALLREYRDTCNCDNGTVPCKLCDRARKVMEEK